MTKQRFAAAALALLAATPAAATITTYASRASFDAAAGATSSFDFEGIITFNGIRAYGFPTQDFGPFTVSTNSGSLAVIDEGYAGGSQFSMGTSDSLYVNGSPTLTFDVPLFSLGMDLGAFAGGTTLTITLPTGSFSVITPASNTGSLFFGLTSTEAFSSVVVAFAGGDNAVKIDNLSFSSTAAEVPEPAMLGLFGLGMIGLGLSRRRKVQ
jgi:hypothetical protein